MQLPCSAGEKWGIPPAAPPETQHSDKFSNVGKIISSAQNNSSRCKKTFPYFYLKKPSFASLATTVIHHRNRGVPEPIKKQKIQQTHTGHMDRDTINKIESWRRDKERRCLFVAPLRLQRRVSGTNKKSFFIFVNSSGLSASLLSARAWQQRTVQRAQEKRGAGVGGEGEGDRIAMKGQ